MEHSCDTWCAHLEAFRQNNFGEVYDKRAFFERLTGVALDSMLEFRLDPRWTVDHLIDELRLMFCNPQTFDEIREDIRTHKREPGHSTVWRLTC